MPHETVHLLSVSTCLLVDPIFFTKQIPGDNNEDQANHAGAVCK